MLTADVLFAGTRLLARPTRTQWFGTQQCLLWRCWSARWQSMPSKVSPMDASGPDRQEQQQDCAGDGGAGAAAAIARSSWASTTRNVRQLTCVTGPCWVPACGSSSTSLVAACCSHSALGHQACIGIDPSRPASDIVACLQCQSATCCITCVSGDVALCTCRGVWMLLSVVAS